MSVHFTTNGAAALLREFDRRIHQTEATGKITTWEKSADGNFYTHKAKEWHAKAWMKPVVQNDQLVFNIVRPQNANISSLVYAYYHGHLSETFLHHFDKMFSWGMSSALPSTGDVISA
jgi:hypothetical protein